MSALYEALCELAQARDERNAAPSGEGKEQAVSEYTNGSYDAGRGMVIPAHLMQSLHRYIEQGCPVGDFLQAVLSNDLREACGRADESNRRILPAFVIFLYNEAPSPCWGSRAKYEAWLAKFAAAREKAARAAP